jgi:Ran GTPase-activating protein (RanGAP) involved in mRNA processing and transport
MKPQNAMIALQSIDKHMNNLQVLNLSKNELGLEGGKYLATQILKVKKLKELRLAECNITDKGVIELIKSVDEINCLEVLDLSGNQIGKSQYFGDLVGKFERYLNQNTHLERLYLDDNNLRAQNGERILKAICQTLALTHLSVKKNFLGIALKGTQAPICVLSNLLLKSVSMQELDVSWN